MEDIFIKLLNMSITASYFVLALLILRIVFRKIPKWVLCALWGLTGIRLILPFSFESILSLIPGTQTVPSDIMYQQSPHITSGIPIINHSINPIINEAFAPEPYESANPLQIVMFILSAIWVMGIVTLLIYTIVSYLIVRKKTSVRIKDENGVYICDSIDTPFILGIIKPKIFIPSDITEEDKHLIISHERAHIKRLDHLWKPLGFLLLTVYWFNSVLWVAYIFLCRDIEAACDEKVIKEYGAEIKKDYSNALINCSAPKKLIRACPLAFGETGVKQRIKGILSYKKPRIIIIITAVITSIILGLCFMTDPMSTRISDIENNASVFSNVNKLQLYIGSSYIYTTEDPTDELNELKKVKLESTPKDESRDENRDKSYRIELNDKLSINIDESFSYLWINDGVKPTYLYKIKNPDILKNLFCISNYAIENTNSEHNGVYITLDSIRFSKDTTSFDVTWHNETEEELLYGEFFSIEKNNKYGDWEEIPFPDNYSFITIGYILEPDSVKKRTYTFPYALSEHGAYRFSTNYHTEDNIKYFTNALFFVGSENSGIGVGKNPLTVSGEKMLTLEDVIKLSEKGDRLTMEDFDDYSYSETGSGLYIRLYEIDEMFSVFIGSANKNTQPLYFYLTSADSYFQESRIDIRYEDVNEFIEKHKNNPVIKNISFSFNGFDVKYNERIYSRMIKMGGIPLNSYDRIMSLTNVKLSSTEELKDFIVNMKNIAKPEHFDNLDYYFTNYNEEYFKYASLIIIYASSDSSAYAYRPEFAYITESEKTLTVGIEKIIAEKPADTDEQKGYFTLLEVENDILGNVNTINAYLTSTAE